MIDSIDWKSAAYGGGAAFVACAFLARYISRHIKTTLEAKRAHVKELEQALAAKQEELAKLEARNHSAPLEDAAKQ